MTGAGGSFILIFDLRLEITEIFAADNNVKLKLFLFHFYA